MNQNTVAEIKYLESDIPGFGEYYTIPIYTHSRVDDEVTRLRSAGMLEVTVFYNGDKWIHHKDGTMSPKETP